VRCNPNQFPFGFAFLLLDPALTKTVLVVRVKLVPFQQSLHLKPPREPEVTFGLKSGL
jgi:hypothetical protein